MTPVALGMQLPKGALKASRKGYYEVPLVEHDMNNKVLGAFAFRLTKR